MSQLYQNWGFWQPNTLVLHPTGQLWAPPSQVKKDNHQSGHKHNGEQYCLNFRYHKMSLYKKVGGDFATATSGIRSLRLICLRYPLKNRGVTRLGGCVKRFAFLP